MRKNRLRRKKLSKHKPENKIYNVNTAVKTCDVKKSSLFIILKLSIIRIFKTEFLGSKIHVIKRNQNIHNSYSPLSAS